MRNRTAATTSGVLAALALAATLSTGNAAGADVSEPIRNPQDSARAGAGTHTGSAAGKADAAPVTVAARQGSKLQAECGTSIDQPGGAGTTIHVSYNNCWPTSSRVTPTAQAVNGSGTYTYVGWCATIPHGYIGTWSITPDWFPPADAHNYSVTTCL